jgi:hypothetical protein
MTASNAVEHEHSSHWHGPLVGWRLVRAQELDEAARQSACDLATRHEERRVAFEPRLKWAKHNALGCQRHRKWIDWWPVAAFAASRTSSNAATWRVSRIPSWGLDAIRAVLAAPTGAASARSTGGEG